MPKRVLTVAETDTTGSSGIQADIKTILALGGYATTAVSSVFVQNTTGLIRSCAMKPEFVAEQMNVILDDIGTDAIKIGYLDSAATINAVGDVLDQHQREGLPVVVDPSLTLRDGTVLVDDEAVAALKRRLYIRCDVLTPNLREAEILIGMTIKDLDDMRHASDMMRTLGVANVVLKAGQVLSEKVLYFIASEDSELVFEHPMLGTGHTLGAGCTLSSAVALGLAQGLDVAQSVERGLDFMHQAMVNAPGFGQHAGPMNHAFDIEKHSDFCRSDIVKVNDDVQSLNG